MCSPSASRRSSRANPAPHGCRSRKPIRFTEFGCPAIDRGTNQLNVFFDPKSSESAAPYFSRGWRDDAIQRSYLEATALYWAEPANNPASSLTGLPMVDLSECAAWTWDARPHPFLPRAHRRLVGWRELAARPLAHGPAGGCLARRARAAPVPRRRHGRRSHRRLRPLGCRRGAGDPRHRKPPEPPSPCSPATSASTPSRARA
ncbi:glycoside hydrolase TIM-barrel-like domain-containing protein [Jhaorihella thermophila]